MIEANKVMIGNLALQGMNGVSIIVISRSFLFSTVLALMEPIDQASYFDLSPIDGGEYVRRDIALELEKLGFVIQTAHHEVAPGQNEINFRFANVLQACDNVQTFKQVVKFVAHKDGYLATFMCPGGYVVNSSSEENSVLTNGMSNNARDGKNGNAALLVNVGVKDYFHGHPLDGFFYREALERSAFCRDKPYCAPAEKMGDFLKASAPTSFGKVQPTYEPGVYLSDLGKFLPPFIADSLREGLPLLAGRQTFYQDPEAVMTGFETRSSSPVRIPRDANGESNLRGLFPLGEGASYAGGITSAALDGLKIALAFLTR